MLNLNHLLLLVQSHYVILCCWQKGPNRTPFAAICLTSLLTMAFIFIGQVNVLAPIVTINFMLTYSFIDYSFFSVAMTFLLQTKQKKTTLVSGRRRRSRRSSTKQSSKPLLESTTPNYGSGGESPQGKGTLLEFTRDMDQIFPPASKPDPGSEKTPVCQELSSRYESRKATAKQKLMDSFGLDLNSNVEEERSSAPHEAENETQVGDEVQAGDQPQVKCLTSVCSVEPDSPAESPGHTAGDALHPSNTEMELRWCYRSELICSELWYISDDGEKTGHQNFEIRAMRDSCYTKLCNHWIALIGVDYAVQLLFCCISHSFN